MMISLIEMWWEAIHNKDCKNRKHDGRGRYEMYEKALNWIFISSLAQCVLKLYLEEQQQWECLIRSSCSCHPCNIYFLALNMAFIFRQMNFVWKCVCVCACVQDIFSLFSHQPHALSFFFPRRTVVISLVLNWQCVVFSARHMTCSSSPQDLGLGSYFPPSPIYVPNTCECAAGQEAERGETRPGWHPLCGI